MLNKENNIKEALLSFDKNKVRDILNELKNQNETQLISHLLTKILQEFGRKWEEGEYSLAQIYMSGSICEELVNEIFDNRETTEDNSKIAIVTFKDHHLLGKKIMFSSIISAGINITDFKQIEQTKELVEKSILKKVEILLISTLMLPSALEIKNVVKLFREEKYPVKIVVGGAPFMFDKELWKKVGADAVGFSPNDGIKIINNWKKNNYGNLYVSAKSAKITKS